MNVVHLTSYLQTSIGQNAMGQPRLISFYMSLPVECLAPSIASYIHICLASLGFYG